MGVWVGVPGANDGVDPFIRCRQIRRGGGLTDECGEA